VVTGARPMQEGPRKARAQALARERLAALDPWLVAQRSGASYAVDPVSAWEVAFLGRVHRVSCPSGEVTVLPEGAPAKHAASLILLHYMAQASGAPLLGRWVAFRELPDGLLYQSAFRGRVEPPLVAAFGNRPERLEAVGRALGGRALGLGDVSFALHVLPRVAMAVILHTGDDEFAPDIRLLFDGVAGQYLPTEDLAILGGLLTGLLLKTARC